LSFYRTRRAQDIIVGVVSDQPSFAAYAEIIRSLELLKLAMQPFYYGSNYSDTLKGIVWVLSSLYILRATRDKYGVPMSFERFDQLIPAAYNNLIKQTVESNRWVIYKTIAEGFRDFILDAGVLDIKDADAVKMFVKVEEDRVEAVRHAVLQATGTIDLADRKWQTNDAQLPQAW
jgi:hypothetical protein